MKRAKISNQDAPEGSLRIGKSQGCVQYYHRTDKSSNNGIYIPKKEIELVRKLAQKSYNKKVICLAEKRIVQINKILTDYDDNEIDNLYIAEHEERKKFIEPMEKTFSQKIEEWISIPYKGKEFRDDAPVILSNRGLRVRSKSEKILADFFDSYNISYKYECPLYLKKFGTVYPDFTFISPFTGEEIYWEHEGMMDNGEYARSAVKKIEAYELNKIYLGDRLLLTFETSATVINNEIIKSMVEKYLLRK